MFIQWRNWIKWAQIKEPVVITPMTSSYWTSWVLTQIHIQIPSLILANLKILGIEMSSPCKNGRKPTPYKIFQVKCFSQVTLIEFP